MKITELEKNPDNPRTITAAKQKMLLKALTRFGDLSGIVFNRKTKRLVGGHQRRDALDPDSTITIVKKYPKPTKTGTVAEGYVEMGQERFAYREVLWDPTTEKAANLAANKGAGEWDPVRLGAWLRELSDFDTDFDVDLTMFDTAEVERLIAEQTKVKLNPDGTLSGRFLVPPFSVFDARKGYWQERKREWLKLGIKSEEGRAELNTANCAGRTFKNSTASLSVTLNKQISIFDPVLCEIVYRWFSRADGVVIDPFAGGSVRGIVASLCKRKYYGVDLRAEQIKANKEQGEALCKKNKPTWVCGDSVEIQKHLKGVKADLLFSCPPYADLEVYSKNPKDISSMAYPEFRKAYTKIIANSCALLADNRFACFVVGEVRGSNGIYYNFVSDTIAAFLAAGLSFYNEAIFLTPIGTTGLATSRNFPIGRKLGKVHQNVLIFCKGDPAKAVEASGKIELSDEFMGEFDEPETPEKYGEEL